MSARIATRLVVLAGAAMLLAGASDAAVDGDLFHELSLWREVLATGSFPRTDSFAFTPTVDPVVHHEWGFGGLNHGAVALFGPAGVLLVKFALIATLAILATRQARVRGATAATLALLAPVSVMLAWTAFATVRAHLATLVGVAIVLGFLNRDRAGDRRWILGYVALQLVWQNLHGGFVVGPGLIALHAMEQALRRRPFAHLIGVLVLAAALPIANPWGADYYGYLARALTMSRPLITEWDSPFSELSVPLVVFVIALAPLGYVLVARGARPLEGLPLLIAGVAEAALHQRFLPLFAVLYFVHVPGWLDGTPLGARLQSVFSRRSFAVGYVAVIVALPMLAQSVVREFWRLRVPAIAKAKRDQRYPVGAVDYLREQGFSGNLWTAFGDGSYVTWKLHPSVKVSLDSRYEVAYRDGVIEEHQEFFAGQGDLKISLDRHRADLVLVPRETPAAERMPGVEGFSACYQDDEFLVYQRTRGTLPQRDRRGERFEGVFP